MDEDRQSKKKKIKLLPLTAAVVAAIAVLSAFLLGYQFRQYEKGLLDVCAVQQDGYVQLVLDQINLNADRSDEEIIEDIIGTLDSSTNKYWTFSKGDQILFVKDVLETNKYRSLTVNGYYDSISSADFVNSLHRDKVTHSRVTLNGDRYIASGTKFRYGGSSYRLVLLTNQSVILDNNTYLAAKTGMITLLAALLLLFVLIPLILAWRYTKLEKVEHDEEDEIESLNGVIEKSGSLVLAASGAPAAVYAGSEREESAVLNRKDYRFYQLKFYLNAEHYIIIDGRRGETHPHTWEFSLDFALPREPFVEFGHVEKEINRYLEHYQNRVINEIEPFDAILPTVENLTEYLAGEFTKIISGFDGILIRVKTSETPTRSYMVLCCDLDNDPEEPDK